MNRQAAVAWLKEHADIARVRATEIGSSNPVLAERYSDQATNAEAIAAMLNADADVRAALKRVHDVTLTLVSGHDDCGDCFARVDSPESDGEVCRAHGDEGSSVVRALMAARDLLGPCVCGHPHQEHESVDSTQCKTCRCHAFTIPETR